MIFLIDFCDKKWYNIYVVEGKLKKNTAVVTVMSNMGFFKFCEANNINCEKTAVGDRYVLESMIENGCVIGGEQSGHIIFLNYTTTGDGTLSSLQFVKAVQKSGKKPSELAAEIEIYPQTLVNAKVANENKNDYLKDKEIQDYIAEIEEEMKGSGRVLIRPSGTEPLVRVMIEGEDIERINQLAEDLAKKISDKYM